MNVPAIAKKSFDELKALPEFKAIYDFISSNLDLIPDSVTRAKLIHAIVDEFNKEIFSHPLVAQLCPCKVQCTDCCHTQVSITSEEADLLLSRIAEGLAIDEDLLKIQMEAKNDSTAFFKIKFEDRRCIFLSEDGSCSVYEDRPAVCRTNAVLGEASQCSTRDSIQKTRLVKTPKSDIAIYTLFEKAESAGTLPYMIGSRLKKKT